MLQQTVPGRLRRKNPVLQGIIVPTRTKNLFKKLALRLLKQNFLGLKTRHQLFQIIERSLGRHKLPRR